MPFLGLFWWQIILQLSSLPSKNGWTYHFKYVSSAYALLAGWRLETNFRHIVPFETHLLEYETWKRQHCILYPFFLIHNHSMPGFYFSIGIFHFISIRARMRIHNHNLTPNRIHIVHFRFVANRRAKNPWHKINDKNRMTTMKEARHFRHSNELKHCILYAHTRTYRHFWVQVYSRQFTLYECVCVFFFLCAKDFR